MSPHSRHPPLDGSVPVLPGFVDFQAQHNPSQPWVVFPSADSPPKAASISFLELAQATHRVAHTLRPGRAGPEQEVVAMLINCDTVLYIATIIGLFRAGVVPFPMSPKNSPEAVCHMLRTTKSHRIVTQPSLSRLTSEVKSTLEMEEYAIELVELPSYDDVFPSTTPQKTNLEISFIPYPPPSIQRRPSDLAMYLHSSGSTGLPKSIPWTERILLHWADSDIVRMCCKYQLLWAVAGMPTFHSTGIVSHVLTPLVSGIPVSLFAPQAPAPPMLPNAQNILEAAVATGSNALAAVPIFIETWCRSPEIVQYLASLECLCWSGGPLSETNGDMLVTAGINLTTIYGITEVGIMNKVGDLSVEASSTGGKRREDWAWTQFDDRVTPRWVDQGDGTYELQILTSDVYPLAVENLPDVPGYATGDVFKPHPTRPDLWRIAGRTDDVIVLRSGEKVVPVLQEDYLNSVPMVSSAIMFGRGQSQPGILIELAPEHAIDPKDESALIAVRNRIWPQIEEANKRAPAFSRLFKETLLISDPSKPFARTGKGTPIRKVTLRNYDTEINDLYERLEASTDPKGVVPPKSWELLPVQTWLGQHAASINSGQTPALSDDLFEQGFDSLSATFLRNRIIGTLRNSGDKTVQAAASRISQDFIYKNPTLSRLSNAVVTVVNPYLEGLIPLALDEEIQAMIAKYSAELPVFEPYQPPSTGTTVVLLTGSTGSLGSHLLASLLAEESVLEVITLNRGTNVDERQHAAFVSRGLSTDLLSGPKLTSLTGDMKRADLGLDKVQLNSVRSRVTHVIHNAWKVDFYLALSSFESYVASTRSLIDFSASCTKSVRFLLTASATSVYNWDVRKGPIPEEVINDPSVASVSGYGASKYVAEHILAHAARQGLSATSARIGQISGSTISGDWNTSEWIPTLVKTSLAMGYVPHLPGVVSWIPINTTAQTVIDVLLTKSSVPEVFNLVHPHPVLWDDVFSDINEVVQDRMKVIPFERWVELVAATPLYKDETHPAVKLLQFWRVLFDAIVQNTAPGNLAAIEAAGLPVLQTRKVEGLSQTFKDVIPIGRKDVELWLDHWRHIGFLSEVGASPRQ